MMASKLLFANNASSTLAGAITSSAISCNVASGGGAKFPDPGLNEFFVMTFTDNATGLLNEIVWVTAVTGDTFTLIRAQEGTDALNWLAGDACAQLWTAGQAGAMVQQVAFQPARIQSISGVFTMTTADSAIGLQRLSAPAASSSTLPAGSQIGQLYSIEDLAANFQAFPVTIFAPTGMTIANEASVTLNVNRQCAYFRFYGSNVWSVKL